MQPESIYIIITIFSSILFVFIGFALGRIARKDPVEQYLSHREEPLTKEEVGKAYKKAVEMESHSGIDIKNGGSGEDGEVGIVYRPSVEEIEKMNEPQKVKEAKEAIAEELRKEVPPEI